MVLLELELQKVVNHHMGSGAQTWASVRATSAFELLSDVSSPNRLGFGDKIFHWDLGKERREAAESSQDLLTLPPQHGDYNQHLLLGWLFIWWLGIELESLMLPCGKYFTD